MTDEVREPDGTQPEEEAQTNPALDADESSLEVDGDTGQPETIGSAEEEVGAAIPAEGEEEPPIADDGDGEENLVADSEPVVQPVEFDELEASEAAGGHASLDLLLDVKLPITVELGRTELEVKEILEFGPGSIIELTKEANEPVDLLVNGVLVARGEVVVVDEYFGVRLTGLVSPEERIRVLGDAA